MYARNAKLTVLLVMAVASFSGDPAIGQTDVARVELHPFKSATMSDRQFLTGSKDGTEVIIAGELRIPKPGTERLPAVVLIHGSGGIGRNSADWVTVLNGIGLATFLVDSFTARGLVNVTANQAVLGRLVQT